ncbi:MAG TPA: radical SAM family heme chaperone HemW [Bacteroidales bacterium]|nr:radical SAM family heme chaperone HemW [Bacteroidales bacterium]HNS45688.1 radical SAM family heme chaperone HemW [Bacteroidales bacterium]
MPGIYLHIPFCRKKCHYCNFYSSTLLQHKQYFTDALTKEIILRSNYLSTVPVQTVYFGGGTPSLLTAGDLARIFGDLNRIFQIADDAEITLEANPDDLTGKYLSDLRTLPVNRLSIGIQSFFDDDLHFLNRIHSARVALDSIKRAQDKGFLNLSVDLIYGIPTLTREKWAENLQIAFSLDIPHISAYALTVEPGTSLEKLIIRGKAVSPDEEAMVDHFNLLCDEMRKNGYAHYEISNFCKEKNESRHNIGYWTGEPYLGLGPSAHSYNGISRQWNRVDVRTYIESIRNGQPDIEVEILSRDQKYNEYVMTSLRTVWGCNTEVVLERFGRMYNDYLLGQAAGWIKSGHLISEKDVLKLTHTGKLFADRITSDLFLMGE